jgi:hypothetical protein
MDTGRMYTVFHESFSLSLPSIAKILRLSATQGSSLSSTDIVRETNLGSGYVKAMPRYGRACGLIDLSGFGLTPFGELAAGLDPHLTHSSTLWLMHYHLSAPHGPGPAFWSHLVSHCLPLDSEVESAAIVAALTDFLGERVMSDRALRTTATVFLGTYAKADGLGRLGLLDAVTGKKALFRVSEAKSPPLWAFAYALADFWDANYGEQVTVSVGELSGANGFARSMWMDSRLFNACLEALRRVGVVDLYRAAQPYQVARLWNDKRELLQHIYD